MLMNMEYEDDENMPIDMDIFAVIYFFLIGYNWLIIVYGTKFLYTTYQCLYMACLT